MTFRRGMLMGLAALLAVAPLAEAAGKKPIQKSTNVVYKVGDQLYRSKPEVMEIDGRIAVFSSETPVNVNKFVKGTQTKKNPAQKSEHFFYQANNLWKEKLDILLARTVFGEGRGLVRKGRINEAYGIAYNPVNRANDGIKYNGTTVRGAILKPYQFSCFNRGDPNRKVLLNPMKYDPQIFKECLVIAKNTLERRVPDPSKGANLYYNPETSNPNWAYAKNVSPIPPDGKIREADGSPGIHKFCNETRQGKSRTG